MLRAQAETKVRHGVPGTKRRREEQHDGTKNALSALRWWLLHPVLPIWHNNEQKDRQKDTRWASCGAWEQSSDNMTCTHWSRHHMIFWMSCFFFTSCVFWRLWQRVATALCWCMMLHMIKAYSPLFQIITWPVSCAISGQRNIALIACWEKHHLRTFSAWFYNPAHFWHPAHFFVCKVTLHPSPLCKMLQNDIGQHPTSQQSNDKQQWWNKKLRHNHGEGVHMTSLC